MVKFFQFFTSQYWIIRKYAKRKDKILHLWKQYRHLSDQALKAKTKEFIQHYQKNQDLDALLEAAYAVACEAIRRVTQLSLYPVQIIGAIVLHYGDVAEMRTGEGKTLTSVLPAYLNSFLQKSVFIVTVNEYLVNRDCEENGKIFKFLGISVGKTLNSMTTDEKRKNYLCDIVYGTNSEFGFDYLRDNMMQVLEAKMQRNHYYVIIDEVDLILIDEGITPLIISGKPRNRSKLYKQVDAFVKGLGKLDYGIDNETKRCFLQKTGIFKAEKTFHLTNLFSSENSELFHFISNALQSNYILKKNIDYLVKNNKIYLIDHFTGRVMGDRVLSEGLHQALEAKEGCHIRQETSVLATITYQNYFRLFDKISGMTGTAKSEEDEFIKIFNMHVIAIPTNKQVIRFDDNDCFFYNKKEKYLALIDHIQKLYNRNQPILVGTCSLESSEEISKILRKLGLKFNVLNAKHHEFEAKVIAKAGIHKSITISTNMAGRGTDIKLDAIAKKAGGLAVLGVERNESRRIDNQLQGRSGRQGEPGYAVFYVSLDDALFLRFGNQKFKKIFKPMQKQVLTSRALNYTIAKAQKKLLNANYDQRKNLLEYDNVISQQRQVVYQQRDLLLTIPHLDNYLQNLLTNYLFLQWKEIYPYQVEFTQQEIFLTLPKLLPKGQFSSAFQAQIREEKTYTQSEILTFLEKELWNFYQNLEISQYLIYQIKGMILSNIDHLWSLHLSELFLIKASSYLHSYAQKMPLQAFIEESEILFQTLKKKIVFQTFTQIWPLLISFNKKR